MYYETVEARECEVVVLILKWAGKLFLYMYILVFLLRGGSWSDLTNFLLGSDLARKRGAYLGLGTPDGGTSVLCCTISNGVTAFCCTLGEDT